MGSTGISQPPTWIPKLSQSQFVSRWLPNHCFWAGKANWWPSIPPSCSCHSLGPLFLEIIFLPLIFFFYSWDSHYVHVNMHDCVPQFSGASAHFLSSLFHSFLQYGSSQSVSKFIDYFFCMLIYTVESLYYIFFNSVIVIFKYNVYLVHFQKQFASLYWYFVFGQIPFSCISLVLYTWCPLVFHFLTFL